MAWQLTTIQSQIAESKTLGKELLYPRLAPCWSSCVNRHPPNSRAQIRAGSSEEATDFYSMEMTDGLLLKGWGNWFIVSSRISIELKAILL